MTSNHCVYCGTSIGKRWPMPVRTGYRYSDGRHICEECHRGAVKDDHQLLQAWRFVAQACEDLGLKVAWPAVKVRLRHVPAMENMAGGSGYVGLARNRWADRWIDGEVTVLYGLPPALCVSTLAHEAGHVWCHTNNLRKGTSAEFEGFCNVVACLVLKQLSPELKPQQQVDEMFGNNDPIYGGGFRSEWALLQKSSWAGYRDQKYLLWSER